MKAEISASWTSASRYPSEIWSLGTSWTRVTASDGASGDERPRSLWRSADCKRWSAVEAAELMRTGSVTDVLILSRRSSMICARGTLRLLARRTIAPHWLVERGSERHSASSSAVRRAATALRKGTKTAELVGPIGRGGGRQDLMLWDVATRAATGLPWERWGKSSEDHCTQKGPDREGMEIADPPVMGVEGRICARSAKIWVWAWADAPGM